MNTHTPDSHTRTNHRSTHTHTHIHTGLTHLKPQKFTHTNTHTQYIFIYIYIYSIYTVYIYSIYTHFWNGPVFLSEKCWLVLLRVVCLAVMETELTRHSSIFCSSTLKPLLLAKCVPAPPFRCAKLIALVFRTGLLMSFELCWHRRESALVSVLLLWQIKKTNKKKHQGPGLPNQTPGQARKIKWRPIHQLIVHSICAVQWNPVRRLSEFMWVYVRTSVPRVCYSYSTAYQAWPEPTKLVSQRDSGAKTV